MQSSTLVVLVLLCVFKLAAADTICCDTFNGWECGCRTGFHCDGVHSILGICVDNNGSVVDECINNCAMDGWLIAVIAIAGVLVVAACVGCAYRCCCYKKHHHHHHEQAPFLGQQHH